jgi:hypothetical protein
MLLPMLSNLFGCLGGAFLNSHNNRLAAHLLAGPRVNGSVRLSGIGSIPRAHRAWQTRINGSTKCDNRNGQKCAESDLGNPDLRSTAQGILNGLVTPTAAPHITRECGEASFITVDQCNRNSPPAARISAGRISFECATVTANSGPSSVVCQNERNFLRVGKFGQRS